MNEDWIECEYELPPCDGVYETTSSEKRNIPQFAREVIQHARYDGLGFRCGSLLIFPKFWRHIKIEKKKYGKQKDKP